VTLYEVTNFGFVYEALSFSLLVVKNLVFQFHIFPIFLSLLIKTSLAMHLSTLLTICSICVAGGPPNNSMKLKISCDTSKVCWFYVSAFDSILSYWTT
jgi:hypothetical protein